MRAMREPSTMLAEWSAGEGQAQMIVSMHPTELKSNLGHDEPCRSEWP